MMADKEATPEQMLRLRAEAHDGITISAGAAMIAQERQRQITLEGFSADQDDQVNEYGQLVMAAMYYLDPDATQRTQHYPMDWAPHWAKADKHPLLRRLAISGALIAAEIDRQLRKRFEDKGPAVDLDEAERRWPNAHAWFLEWAEERDRETLYEVIRSMAGRIDGDAIQDLLKDEMDADGYFGPDGPDE